MKVFNEEFRQKIESEEDGIATDEQLKAEYALLQENRELLSRMKRRVADPTAIERLDALNAGLEWLQMSIKSTLDDD